MTKEAVFTLKLEPELRAEFVAEASAAHRPASQIMRELMRDYVARQKAEREHDDWFRAEVEQGLRELRDPKMRTVPHDEVAAKWAIRRAGWLKQAGMDDE